MDVDESSSDSSSRLLLVWVALILVALVSFWFQATITEERFVPALNAISNIYNIPDDIAGATLMAAGASSPELFSSITALFITHSSLGLGTIVGSEIFNQLIICAGAVFACKGDGLILDPAIVSREVFFYALSILLLYFALQDNRPDPDDDSGVDHIYIGFLQACYVVAGYVAYVIVCANMDTIVALFTGKKSVKSLLPSFDGKKRKNSYGSITTSKSEASTASARTHRVSLRHVGDPDKHLYLRETSLHDDPEGNFQKVQVFHTKTGDIHPDDKTGLAKSALMSVRQSTGETDTAQPADELPDLSNHGTAALDPKSRFTRSQFVDSHWAGATLRQVNLLLQQSRPSDEHELYDLEVNSYQSRLSCFMWQRSYFYNKARLATHGWHLRWFTFTPDTMSSVPNRAYCEKHTMHYPAFTLIDLDEKRRIIRIVNPDPKKRSYYLMAPSEEILMAVCEKMEELMELHDQGHGDELPHREGTQQAGQGGDESGEEEFVSSDEEGTLIDFPVGAGGIGIFFFLVLFPFRLMMHLTVPDVRQLDKQGNPMASVSTSFIAIGMCLVWLVIASYGMVASLEKIADLLHIPDTVVGVTVSAAGTSLPNYVASKIAAEKGFGNMAVSNAFGSNTFNIMIGLGLPWLLYTSFGTGFQPYHGLKAEGINESVIILGGVLLVFVAAVLSSNFVILRWHGIMFIVLYVLYLAFEIGRVYI